MKLLSYRVYRGLHVFHSREEGPVHVILTVQPKIVHIFGLKIWTPETKLLALKTRTVYCFFFNASKLPSD